MIQEKTIEAKKQTKEIILSAEEQSKSVVESANIYLKSLALKTTGTLSLQILSSIITTDLDFEIIKMFLRELDSIEIYDESGRKLRGLKEIMLSSIPEEKGIVVKTAHEMPQNLKKEIENKILFFTEKPMKIKYEIDGTLCGGFILSVGFNNIDLSINGQVKNLLEQLG